MPVAFIVKKRKRHPRIRGLRAIGSHAVEFALFFIRKRELRVIRYHKVQKPVTVEIKPGCACRPSPSIFYSSSFGYIGERSVAIIVEQCAPWIAGHVDIGKAVV